MSLITENRNGVNITNRNIHTGVLGRLKPLLRGLVPFGLIEWRWRLLAAKQQSVRSKRLNQVESLNENNCSQEYSYQQAIRFLTGNCSLDLQQVIEGSLPEANLAYCTKFLAQYFENQAIMGLQVGNFVGVSLAYFTNTIITLHPDSLMVSIDPNLTHRGILNPMSKVIALLNRFGLQKNSIVLTGYSLGKSISNDGYVFVDYDPVAGYSSEQGCEFQLQRLAMIASGKFDFCIIDGNHDATYLQQEIDWAAKLLKRGGLIFLDDISPQWKEMIDVFNRLEERYYEKIGYDGRIGVLKVS